MSAIRVNCRKDFTFSVDIQTPAIATGVLGTPALGTLSGIKVRLSATRGGPALNPAVDNLSANERTGYAGRFYYDGDKALLETYVLPLGDGVEFFAVWYKAGDMESESVQYIVADGLLVA